MTTKTKQKSESTEIVPLSSSASSFVSAVKEEDQGQAYPFKLLTIVSDNGFKADTEEAVDVPWGSFHVLGTNLHAKEIKFRPLMQRWKVVKRAGPEDNYKPLGETIFFNDWSEERLDTFGGTSCGRKFGKERKELSEAQDKENRDAASLYLFVWGLATFGDNEPELVQWRMPGSGKSMRWGDATDKRTIGTNMVEREFTIETVLPKEDPLLTASDRKAANNNHPNIIVRPDMSTVLPIEPVAEVGGKVLEWILDSNEAIKDKHHKVAQGRIKDVTFGDLDDLSEDVIEGEYETVEQS